MYRRAVLLVAGLVFLRRGRAFPVSKPEVIRWRGVYIRDKKLETISHAAFRYVLLIQGVLPITHNTPLDTKGKKNYYRPQARISGE